MLFDADRSQAIVAIREQFGRNVGLNLQWEEGVDIMRAGLNWENEVRMEMR